MNSPVLACHVELNNPMWEPAYLRGWVGRAKAWGYSHVLLEGADKYPFRTHKALRHPEGFGEDSFHAFLQHCRDLHLTVIPLVQSLAHAEHVLTTPGYEPYRARPDIQDHYKPADPRSRNLIIELIDDVIEQTQPKEWIHVGGDEAKRLAEYSQSIGADPGELYLEHMQPIFEHVRKRGLRPVIWTDMVLSYPDILDRIPKYVAMCDWEYDNADTRTPRHRIWGHGRVKWADYARFETESFARHFKRYAIDRRSNEDGCFVSFFYTDALLDKGFEVLTAPATRCSGDSAGISLVQTRVRNCFHFAHKGVAQASGTIVTSWSGRGNHPETSLPAEYAGVRGALAGGAFDEQRLFSDFTLAHYGVRLPAFGTAARLSSDALWAFSAHHLGRGRRSGNKAKHLAEIAQKVVQESGGASTALAKLEALSAGYLEARKTFEDMKAHALKNAWNLDFWIEGADMNLFSCEMLKAACEETLGDSGTRRSLRDRLDALKCTTTELFRKTFAPDGADEQVKLRYDFYQGCLLQHAANSGRMFAAQGRHLFSSSSTGAANAYRERKERNTEMIRSVCTTKAPGPAGHYSQAIVHHGLVFVSGQLPIDPVTGEKRLGSIEEQTGQALENVEAILLAAGSCRAKVLKVTIYVSDISLWGSVNAVYAKFFGAHRPARAVVPTRDLHYGCLIEVEAVAAIEA